MRRPSDRERKHCHRGTACDKRIAPFRRGGRAWASSSELGVKPLRAVVGVDRGNEAILKVVSAFGRQSRTHGARTCGDQGNLQD